jgi:hypothetical protein
MSVRTRKYVVLGITVIASAIYGQLATGWSDVEYYAGAAGLIVVIVLAGNSWIEFAPDGAFRQDGRPQA